MARKSNLPLHSNRDAAWDGDRAASLMLDDATDSDGNINSSRASEGFTYMLNDGANRGDYKSPFASIFSGRKEVVRSGVIAAKQRNGSVKGISEEERSSGMRFLERQQARFDGSDNSDGEQGAVRGIRLQTQRDEDAPGGEIIVHSGNTIRNRDFWTGKPFRFIPSGMRIEHWLKNPQVLWMHNFYIPIGTSDMYYANGMLMANNLKFHRKKIPVASDKFIGDSIGEFDTGVIADLWDEGWLKTVSVHIILTPEDEMNVINEEEMAEIIIPTSEVIEYSVVTIPADRDAIRMRMMGLGVTQDIAECVTCNLDAGRIMRTAESGISRPVSINSEVYEMASTTKEKKFMSVQPSFATAAEAEPPRLEMAEEELEPEAVESDVEEAELEVEVEIDEAAEEEGTEPEQAQSVIELGDAEIEALAQALAANERLVEVVMASPVVIARLRQAFGLDALEERVASLETAEPETLEAVPQKFKLVIAGGNQTQAQELRAPRPVQKPAGPAKKPAYAPSKREQMLTSIVRG